MTDFKNTIYALTKIQVKPLLWVVRQSSDLTYELHATYLEQEMQEFFPITTARGQIKKYSTIKAVIHDIRKVCNNPVVQFNFLDI